MLQSTYPSQMKLVESVRLFKVASPMEREAILLRNVFLGSLFLTAFFALMASPMALVMAADHNLTLRQAIAAVIAAYVVCLLTGFARKKGLYGGPRL